MFSLKMLSLPLLPNEKIVKMLDFPDLLRFANCSSKTADLVRLSNIARLKLIVQLKQKCVNVVIKDPHDEERVFNLVVNEKDYTGEDGFEWNGLGGLTFFESSAVGRRLDYPEGPAEDEFSNPSDDSNSGESDQESDQDSDEDTCEESDENPNERSDENSDAESDKHLDEVSGNGSDEDGFEDESEQESNASDEDLGEEIEADLVAVPARISDWYCKVSSSANQTVFEVADLLITYLFDLFGNTEIDHMALRPTDASKQLVEKHEQLQRCETLAITDFWTSEFCRPLTKELMEWSIDAVEAKDECYYLCNVIGEFKWDRGFKTKNVEVEYGHWVHLNAILESESETIYFYRYLPSSTFINTFLKAWISNEKMQNMKKVKWDARKVDDLTEAYYKRVMNGIPEATMTEEERERVTSALRETDWEEDEGEFTKFFRRIDGKLGAVFINTCEHMFSFVAP